MLGYPINEIVWLVLLILAGGVVTGILAGLFGIGGGGIIVPVLYEVFDVLHVPDSVRMQLCIGTSLAIIVPTTVRSYLGHKTKGAVIPQVIRVWTLPAIAGVVIGSITAWFAPSAVFKIAFVFFAALISARCCSPATAGTSARNYRVVACCRCTVSSPGCFPRWSASAAARCRTRCSRSTASRCSARSLPPPASACRSPSSARSAMRLPAGRMWRNCRRCPSASFR